MITEDYISFETAKLLKEKRFDDEDEDIWYDKRGETFFEHNYNISSNWRIRHGEKIYPCPTLQMTMRWLREVHKIYIEINLFDDGFFTTIKKFNNGKIEPVYKDPMAEQESSYEEIQDWAIKYCLEHLI